MKKEQNAKIRVLRTYLGSNKEIIEIHDNIFSVNPHTTMDGTSPVKAQELIALVREVLKKIYGEESKLWTTDTFAIADAKKASIKALKNKETSMIESLSEVPDYGNIHAKIRTICPEYLKIGIHDVLNTLYFLSPDGIKNQQAMNHILTLREAFNDRPIIDRRNPRETNSGEYLVLTDDEADQIAADNIRDSVWTFTQEFIIDHSSVFSHDNSSRKALAAIQDLCENGNDAITRFIDNMDKFIEDAIKADGRGHFISFYDGKEQIEKDSETKTLFYIYRLN